MNPVAILCNGPTLLDHDLSKLATYSCPTIGLNRSWELLPSPHHVMIDPLQWGMYKRVTGHHIKDWPKGTLYIGKEGLPGARNVTQLNVIESSSPRFSFDPLDHVYLCGSVTWVALQLAVHLRYDPIYFIGLDLMPRGSHGKFWGGEFFPFMEARQRELFGYARGLFAVPYFVERIDVGKSACAYPECVNVNTLDKTRVRAFPIKPFEEVFP